MSHGGGISISSIFTNACCWSEQHCYDIAMIFFRIVSVHKLLHFYLLYSLHLNGFLLTSSSCSLLCASSAHLWISSWITRAYSKSCSSLQDSRRRTALLWQRIFHTKPQLKYKCTILQCESTCYITYCVYMCNIHKDTHTELCESAGRFHKSKNPLNVCVCVRMRADVLMWCVNNGAGWGVTGCLMMMEHIQLSGGLPEEGALLGLLLLLLILQPLGNADVILH